MNTTKYIQVNRKFKSSSNKKDFEETKLMTFIIMLVSLFSSIFFILGWMSGSLSEIYMLVGLPCMGLVVIIGALFSKFISYRSNTEPVYEKEIRSRK